MWLAAAVLLSGVTVAAFVLAVGQYWLRLGGAPFDGRADRTDVLERFVADDALPPELDGVPFEAILAADDVTVFTAPHWAWRMEYLNVGSLPSDPSTPKEVSWRRDIGWPVYCATQIRIVGSGLREPYATLEDRWAIQPVGVAVSTVTIAPACAIILLAPGIVVRVHRRRRGRCPACAHDVRGRFERGCQECGWNRA